MRTCRPFVYLDAYGDSIHLTPVLCLPEKDISTLVDRREPLINVIVYPTLHRPSGKFDCSQFIAGTIMLHDSEVRTGTENLWPHLLSRNEFRTIKNITGNCDNNRNVGVCDNIHKNNKAGFNCPLSQARQKFQ